VALGSVCPFLGSKAAHPYRRLYSEVRGRMLEGEKEVFNFERDETITEKSKFFYQSISRGRNYQRERQVSKGR